MQEDLGDILRLQREIIFFYSKSKFWSMKEDLGDFLCLKHETSIVVL